MREGKCIRGREQLDLPQQCALSIEEHKGKARAEKETTKGITDDDSQER